MPSEPVRRTGRSATDASDTAHSTGGAARAARPVMRSQSPVPPSVPHTSSAPLNGALVLLLIAAHAGALWLAFYEDGYYQPTLYYGIGVWQALELLIFHLRTPRSEATYRWGTAVKLVSRWGNIVRLAVAFYVRHAASFDRIDGEDYDVDDWMAGVASWVLLEPDGLWWLAQAGREISALVTFLCKYFPPTALHVSGQTAYKCLWWYREWWFWRTLGYLLTTLAAAGATASSASHGGGSSDQGTAVAAEALDDIFFGLLSPFVARVLVALIHDETLLVDAIATVVELVATSGTVVVWLSQGRAPFGPLGQGAMQLVYCALKLAKKHYLVSDH